MKIAAVVALHLVFGSAALADKPVETPPPGMGKYIVVLRDPEPRAPSESHGNPPVKVVPPDVAKLGGRVLWQSDKLLIIYLPREAAARLRKDENVEYVQRVWTGEPFGDWKDPDLPNATGRVAAEAVEQPPTWTTGDYAYDPSGNIVSIGTGNSYTYDAFGRLASATMDGVTESYSYDAFGNRTAVTLAGQTTTIPADPASNRLTAQAHDAAGNVTSGPLAASYIYDSAGMMSGLIRMNGTQQRRMIYTASDERIGVYVDHQISRWTIRDLDGNTLREFSTAPAAGYGPDAPLTGWLWSEDYIYAGNDAVGAERAGSVRLHFHRDHLGSTRMMTTENGRKLAIHDYAPFGAERTDVLQETSIDLGPLRRQNPDASKFTGHQRDYLEVSNSDDASAHLDYMHARYYSTAGGRFLSVDPVISKGAMRAPQMWNRYSYVANNPMNRIDPDGRLLQALAGDAGSAEDAFKRLQRLVGDDAAKYLKLNAKTGMVTLSGISRLAYGVRFGKTAGMVADLITTQGHTATFALANSAFAKSGGGGRTEPTETGTRTEVGPGLIPKTAGGVAQNVETTLAHELGHAFQDMYGLKPGAAGFGRMYQRYLVNPHEAFGMWAENNYRGEARLPHRSYYWYGPTADFGNDYIEP